MTSRSVIFSVLTPTWNRAAYLERVWRGLSAQTLNEFEWIIADDGSDDNTEALARDLARRSDFRVVYIRASRRIGKTRMDNEAVAQARGDFILWCDSDDYLLPDALRTLLKTWQAIPAELARGYVGLTAMCSTADGTIIQPVGPSIQLDVSWNELAVLHRVTGDMLHCARTCALKAHPFPEVDFVIPESAVWTAIGDRKTRLVPEALMVKEYRAQNCISFNHKMQYNRGRAHALAITSRNLSGYYATAGMRWRRLITFIRYCIHGEIGWRSAMRLWGGNSSLFAFLVAIPVAWAFAQKDQLQRKVEKTHRAFLDAAKEVKITFETLAL